jgi:hypothetical protein
MKRCDEESTRGEERREEAEAKKDEREKEKGREGGQKHGGCPDFASLLACWPEADWASGSAASMLRLSRGARC